MHADPPSCVPEMQADSLETSASGARTASKAPKPGCVEIQAPGPNALLGPPPGAMDRSIQFRSCRIDGCGLESLHPDEAACLPAGAADARRREFAAGRSCARAAIKALGLADQPVGVAGDRSPIWPKGAVGSITHSGHWAAAAVGLRARGIRAIGLDVEEAVPLDTDLIPEICVEAERDWLACQPASDQGILAKAIFCAKEAAYKCQYPISGRLIGFAVLQIDLEMARGQFSAQFLAEIPPFGKGERLYGGVWLAAGHIATGLSLR